MTHYRLPLHNLEQGVFQESYTLKKEFLTREESFEIVDGVVYADIEGERTGDLFDIMIYLDGEVQVPCSRCDGPLWLPIECEQHLTVKLGEMAGGDGDEVVIVPRSEPTLLLDDEFYSLVVTNIPMHRTHEEGKCSAEVEDYFHKQDQAEKPSNNPFASLLKSEAFAKKDDI